MMVVRVLVLFVVLLDMGCSNNEDRSFDNQSSTAESFFRAIYGCAPENLTGVANPDVATSYPIFETLFDTQVIRGLDAVVAFSNSFCRRWGEPSIAIDDVIGDSDQVVLVWSFSANDQLAEDPAHARQSWGGISVFSFDDLGRVLSEFGEESSPGPSARMATSAATR